MCSAEGLVWGEHHTGGVSHECCINMCLSGSDTSNKHTHVQPHNDILACNIPPGVPQNLALVTSCFPPLHNMTNLKPIRAPIHLPLPS